MNPEQEIREEENPVKDQTEGREDGVTTDGEFKVTVRKLEMPVRPRGVLAE